MTPFVVAGGIVRNRAWILPRHLEAVGDNRPEALFYLANDSEDDTVPLLRNYRSPGICKQLSFVVENNGFPGWRRDGEPRYHSSNMAPLRNRWLELALGYHPDLTHLWVVDSDVLPEWYVLDRLLELDKPVVAPFVLVADRIPVAMEGWDAELGRADRTGEELGRTEPFRATLVGCCYLIRRDAIDAGLRWAPHPQGEDGGFGDKARELGLEMWCEPRAWCEHVMVEPGS